MSLNYVHSDLRELRRFVVAEYAMAIIDPPWRYDNLSGKALRSAPYERILDELLDIFKTMRCSLRTGSHIYLWSTSAFMQTAQSLLVSSGFDIIQYLVWVKLTPTSKRLFFGLGNYYRNACEFALLACKDHRQRLFSNSMRNVWVAPVLPRTAKPAQIEEDWIRASSRVGERVLYLFSGPDKKLDHQGRYIDMFDTAHSLSSRREPSLSSDHALVRG